MAIKSRKILASVLITILLLTVFFMMPKDVADNSVKSIEKQQKEIQLEENSPTSSETEKQKPAQVLGQTETAPKPEQKEESTKVVHQSPQTIQTVHMIEDSNHSQDELNFIPDRLPSQNISAPYSVPNNENNEKEILGFLPYWELSNYEQIQYNRLSTVAYFGLTSNGNGQWVSDSGRTGFNSAQFRQMRDMAHAENVKVLVVVKNFDPASIKRIVGNTSGAGDTLIENIVAAIDAKNLDGVNIDFEYVGNDEHPVTNTLRSNFASWHEKLAQRIHSEFPGSIVNTDVFGSSPLAGTAYDLRALGQTSIDQIMMMTYDYTTTRCYEGKLMAPVSPLYGNDGWSVSYHVDLAAQQVPPGKIIMGVPYYGIDLRVKSADRNIYNARADYPNCEGAVETYSSITDSAFDEYHNDSTIRWNNTEKARWYVYQYAGNWRHGYYDDADSLGAKYDFVRDRNLAGIGIWALNYDKGRDELWNLIRTKFQKVDFIVGFKTGVSSGRINTILSNTNLEVIDDLGNNVYRVKPISGLSSAAIAALRGYREVSAVDFENPRSIRTVNETQND